MYSPLQSLPRCFTDLQTFSDVSLYGGLFCISLYLNEDFEKINRYSIMKYALSIMKKCGKEK